MSADNPYLDDADNIYLDVKVCINCQGSSQPGFRPAMTEEVTRALTDEILVSGIPFDTNGGMSFEFVSVEITPGTPPPDQS